MGKRIRNCGRYQSVNDFRCSGLVNVVKEDEDMCMWKATFLKFDSIYVSDGIA